MRVSVVIPTYNEAGSIAHVLDDIPPFLVSEVLVVDAGSTDGTREIAAGRGARVIVEPRRGYGRACLTGLAAALPPRLATLEFGDDLILFWSAPGFILEQAEEITGPWSYVSDASPVTLDMTGSQRFFRLKSQ